MGSIELPALRTGVKFIFFTDFDGTITLRDSNDWLVDNFGFGQVKRKKENMDVLYGRKSFRDSFKLMMDTVETPFEKCIQLLVENIDFDPGFKEFFFWARENNIPVVVLSSGIEPIIRAMLRSKIGPESDEIQVISNQVRAQPGKSLEDEGGWEAVFHDDSDFGHDKSLTLRPYAQLPEDRRPTMFYAGDGVSDLSAARETDLLFAKEGKDLVTYCVNEGVPFTVFPQWSTIHDTVKNIFSGQQSVQDAAKEGYESYKSANGVVNGK